jgi:Zn-dependent peptidase ImmA (M78 family)
VRRLSHAEQYLIGYGVSKPRQIDLEALAWTMGAKVKYKRLSSCEAKITGLGDRAIITIDDSFGDRRARFSLSHEIGHWQRHRNQILSCSKQDIGGVNGKRAHKEREADRYAADFMMPAYLYRPLMREFKKPSFKSIDALAEEFQASRKASALRYIDMDRSESMLICFGPNGRKWYRGSKDWPDEWVPKRDHDPDSGVMELLFGKTTPGADRSLVPASAFFGRYSAENHNVYAHSVISRSRGGQTDAEVMTFIVPQNSDMFDDVYASRGW